VGSERNRAARWAGRIGLFVALCATAIGSDAVSAQPPAFPERGLRARIPSPAVPTLTAEPAPSLAVGIAAQDNWLGD
jgi:hypothetical protein